MIASKQRFRATAALFAGVGLSEAGFIILVAVTPLVAEDLLGSARYSGLPNALAIVGTAAGTSWLSVVMARHDRRKGLVQGYLIAMLASVLVAMAAGASSFAFLTMAIFGVGIGYGANRLSRYAAADLFEPERQARAISWIVWAGTIGSVLGPMLLEPSQWLSVRLGLTASMGPYLVMSLTMGLAGLVLSAAYPAGSSTARRAASGPLPLQHFRRGKAQVALVALAIGQVVMVLLMTMTPLYVRSIGGDLRAVGYVIAAHTFGMYAISPVSGYLCDRLGQRPIIVAGGAFIVAAGLVSASAGAAVPRLMLGLFLLGWGWNLGFVAGSALLNEAVPSEDRVRLQGFTDSLVWASAAAAGASSGVLFESLGYVALCQLGAVLAIVPAAVIALRSREW